MALTGSIRWTWSATRRLVPYYERFGMRGACSALLRHPTALDGGPVAGL
jgi:hypothetical protein